MFRVLVWAALSFLLVFGVTLAFRVLTARGGRAATALVLADATAATQTITTNVRPGELPTQIGVLLVRNATTSALTLRDAGLLKPEPGLQANGFAVLVPSENDVPLGGQCGPFPPPNFATHPVEGFTLEPGATIAVVAAVRATREGSTGFDGVRLTYAAGKRLFHQDLPLRVRLDARPSNPTCAFDPTPHQRAGAESGAA